MLGQSLKAYVFAVWCQSIKGTKGTKGTKGIKSIKGISGWRRQPRALRPQVFC